MSVFSKIRGSQGNDLLFITLICTAGLFLSFANPILHFPPLIFVFLAGLNHIAFKSQSLRQSIVRSFLVAGLAYSLTLYWVVVPVHRFGGIPLILALFCPLLLGYCLGLFASLYAGFVFTIKKSFNWFWLGIFGGCAWAGLEFLREYALTGFPWLILAQTFAVWPASIQSVSIWGSFGLAMIIAACGIWLYIQKYRTVIFSLLVLALVLGYGFLLPHKTGNYPEKTFLSVQGNVSQDLKWERHIQLLTVQKYIDLTIEGMKEQKPDIVVWPETALPFYFQEPTDLSFKVRDFVSREEIHLLTGSPAYELDEDGSGYTLYNRAFRVSSDGFIVDYYDKNRLVPFGEYIPFSSYIPFLDKLVHGELDFSRGRDLDPMAYGDLALGVLICYEIIFPGMVRQKVAGGANILINISNDAWFGMTSAPVQHLHLSVLRAVEQNRYVIRSTNTGISAFIAPDGVVYNSTSLFEDAVILDKAGLIGVRTLYYELYWVVNFVLIFGVVSALFIHYIKRKRRFVK